jgi:hypothetical protein
MHFTHFSSSLESRPKIFGMTASPIIDLKLDDNEETCREKLNALCKRMDCTVFTPTDINEIR